MAFFAGPELILLAALLAPNGGGADLASQIAPADYFKFNEIETTPKEMLAIAGKEVKSTKSEFQQLMAIRWLSENKDRLGDQEKAVRELLGKLADGKAGFAKDYAQIGMARLDGKLLPILHTTPKDSLRAQAFEWFPDDCTLFGGIDFRAPPNYKPNKDQEKLEKEMNALRAGFFKLVPMNFREELYKFAEAVGNFRIDRVSFAFTPDPNRAGQIYIRLTGQGNLRAIAKYFAGLEGINLNIEEREKEKVIILKPARETDVAFAFVGDTDVIFCFDERQNRVGGGELLEKVLKIRASGKDNLNQGAFGKAIAAVPDDARGILMGIVPEELQKELAGTPLGICPKTVAFELTNVEGKAEMKLKLRAVFDNEEDAVKFSKNGKELIQMGIDRLGDLPPGLKKESVEAFRKALKGIELKVDGTSTYVTGIIDFELQKAAFDFIEVMMKR